MFAQDSSVAPRLLDAYGVLLETDRIWRSAREIRLTATSAKDLPELARRNDLERADGGKAQQCGIASDEQVSAAGECLTEHECVGRIDVHACGPGLVSVPEIFFLAPLIWSPSPREDT